jgi:hypothetical protein
MADFNIIRDVSNALANRLTAEFTAAPLAAQARVENLQPAPSGATPTLSVFLYDVVEDTTLRNRPPVVTMDANHHYRQTRADLPLILRYMLTPWANDPGTAQLMLGCALRALYDAKTWLGAELNSGLANELELVAINLTQLTLEEKAKIWWAIQQPYHVSLNYDVRVVQISPSTDADAGAAIIDRTNALVPDLGDGS